MPASSCSQPHCPPTRRQPRSCKRSTSSRISLTPAIQNVGRVRFFEARGMVGGILGVAGPVVTCSDDILRFEAFSGCCSTYGRLDLLPQAVSGEFISRGTTNVDFNASMRAALARIRDTD